MASRYWSRNLFKGRIGEAIIEAVLSEFGYKVERAGYEQGTGNPRIHPDFLVTHPQTNMRCYVEAKYLSARPTSVDIDLNRILEYRKHYPGTILVVNSAWDGGIYCAELGDISVVGTGGLQTLNLLDSYWKPIWETFSLVRSGDQLYRTWKDLQDTLSMYGTRRLLERLDEKLWEEEYEDIASYLEDTWTEELVQVGIHKPEKDKMTLEELWSVAREINAVGLAEEILGVSDDHPVKSMLMYQVISRALDRKEEGLVAIPIQDIIEEMGLEPNDQIKERLGIFLAHLVKRARSADEGEMSLINKILEKLPDGVGKVHMIDQIGPVEESESVDFKTALKMAIGRCIIFGERTVDKAR